MSLFGSTVIAGNDRTGSTGTSGHAFHKHYTDQAQDWAEGIQHLWAYSEAALDETTVDTLVLEPTR